MTPTLFVDLVYQPGKKHVSRPKIAETSDSKDIFSIVWKFNLISANFLGLYNYLDPWSYTLYNIPVGESLGLYMPFNISKKIFQQDFDQYWSCLLLGWIYFNWLITWMCNGIDLDKVGSQDVWNYFLKWEAKQGCGSSLSKVSIDQKLVEKIRSIFVIFFLPGKERAMHVLDFLKETVNACV